MSIQKDIDPVDESIKEGLVVDADVHVSPSIDDLLPYMEDRDDGIQEKIESTSFPPDGHPPATTNWTASYATNEGGDGLDTQGHATTGEDVLEAIEETGVDIPLVTSGLNRLPATQNPRMGEAICRAFNNYLLDRVTSVDENVKAMAMIPQWNPEAIVEELDRIGDEEDIVAIYGWFGPFEPMGLPKFDPVYEKLIELDLPWALHGSAAFWPKYEPLGNGMRSWNEFLGFAWPCHAIMNTVNMILTGVFDSYPDLSIVYQEAGLNWLPFVANRLDEFYQDHPEDIQLTERMYDNDRTYLERLPSEYLFDNFYFATQPISLPDRSRHAKAQLEMCHADECFVFSSDWPHHTFDVPNWLARDHIDDETRTCVLHENAMEVFRI